MALLPILHYPDPRLKTIAAPVTQFDATLAQLAQDMLETMYDAPGVGLAATQVDVHQQILVMDVSEKKDTPHILVNPRIVQSSAELSPYEEGCLSVPEIFDEIKRPARVTVEAQNLKGDSFTLEADGLLAVCVQHEIDHLKGIVFVEYLSALKQGRIKTKLKKAAKK